MKYLLLSTLLVVIALFSLTASAIDYWGGPPPSAWNRGDSGTTFEHWDFDTADLYPSEFDNTFGTPVMSQIDPADWEFGSWVCPTVLDASGTTGGWHCIRTEGEALSFTIPNTPATDGTKWIFLQITSTQEPLNITAAATGMISLGTWDTQLPTVPWAGPAPFGGSWKTYNYGLFIRPNPNSETVTFEVPFNTVIDQIVVDTLCSTGPIRFESGNWGDFKIKYLYGE